MSWNDGIQRRKFISQQEKQAEEYRKLGMSEEQIKAMYEFDLEQFRSDRRYQMHTQRLVESDFEDDCGGDNGKSPMLEKFIDNLSVYDHYFFDESRFWWIDEIDDQRLAEKLRCLSEADKELLALIVFDGYTQVEVAEMYNKPKQRINEKLARIKKYLKN